MSLANVALQVRGFLVLGIAENVWAFVHGFALVRELVSYEFNVVPELLAANRAWQMALKDSILEVTAILRNV